MSALVRSVQGRFTRKPRRSTAGWQIAGYTGADDGWAAFILFRHPNQQHLVRCHAGYDVPREKRVQTNCYKLR